MEVDGERGVGAGRRVRTARSLQQGEVVLSEPALVTGPRLSSVLVCVSCCSRLTLTTPVPCPTCGLPLCSSCHSAPANHSRECLLFSNNNIHFSFKTTSQAKLISPVVTIIRLGPNIWRADLISFIDFYCLRTGRIWNPTLRRGEAPNLGIM